MPKEKPSIPKGTRDFLPAEMARRKFIFNTIEATFQLYGFQPIETPAMENTSTLLGKYGEEGDKLLFRILNSGDFLASSGVEDLGKIPSPQLAARICEKGLRYDLTVPFARFVVQHRNELNFPFRRYQIQPVWRADKPQKGRYREFYQCDADVIGSTSLFNEAELVKMVDDVFRRLGLPIVIHLNNRKILAGMAAYIGHADKLTDITIALDKLEKTSLEAVLQELENKGIDRFSSTKLLPLLNLEGDNRSRLAALEPMVGTNASGSKGLEEMRLLFDYLDAMQLTQHIEFELSLARGLDYYTGTIIEVSCLAHAIGSLCGGGRYDDLTGIFGWEGLSGVGISFGADRIYDTLLALQKFPEALQGHARIFIVNFGAEDEKAAILLLNKLRANGISAEMYPEAAKLKKQLSYANALRIRHVALIGESERLSNTITLKDMQDGTQQTLDWEAFLSFLQA